MVKTVFCTSLESTESIESSSTECSSFDTPIVSHSLGKLPTESYHYEKFTKQDAAEAIAVEWEQVMIASFST